MNKIRFDDNNKLCSKNYLSELKSGLKETFKGTMLFLDRDGVINIDYGHVNSTDRLEFIPMALDLIRIANKKCIPVTVVSNQAGVAKGLYTENELLEFNIELFGKLRELNCNVQYFFYCPSHPEGNVKNLRKVCLCRKPGDLIFKYVVLRARVSASKSLFIGNTESDREAALRIGIPFIMVNTDEHQGWKEALTWLNKQ